MKLLAVVLLLLPLSTCWAAVVNDFQFRLNGRNCQDFFVNVNGVRYRPTKFIGDGGRFKPICQTLNGQIEFATYYDTTYKIPVYSAYKFTGRQKCDRKLGAWFIEPQLDNPAGGNNMATENTANNRGTNQALNEDYEDVKFHKGHLAPVCHQNKQNCADATFTLTNAAPQVGSFNINWYHYMENPVSIILQRDCIDEGRGAHIVTGTVPGTETIKNKGRVHVPTHFWSAFCCLNNNGAQRSGAFIGKNEDVSKYKDQRRKWVERKSVWKLEEELTELYKGNLEKDNNNKPERFTLFGGQCNEGSEPPEDPHAIKRKLRPEAEAAKKRKCISLWKRQKE